MRIIATSQFLSKRKLIPFIISDSVYYSACMGHLLCMAVSLSSNEVCSPLVAGQSPTSIPSAETRVQLLPQVSPMCLETTATFASFSVISKND